VAWYENSDGSSFGEERVITAEMRGVVSVYVADLTGNGRLDVLSASEGDLTIRWYENLGMLRGVVVCCLFVARVFLLTLKKNV